MKAKNTRYKKILVFSAFTLDFCAKFLPLNTAKIHALCMVYIMMSKTEEKFVNFVTHKCFC